MGNFYVFNRSVRGALHIKNDFPCEDSSASWKSEDGKVYIAATADGHGDPRCFRSDIGSAEAADAAISALRTLSEAVYESEESEERFYREILSSQRNRQITMRHLTDSILADWNNRVMDDYQKRPVTEEELAKAGGQIPENIAHIYGTTLIAALLLPKCLILIQQGDGRCEIFYDDGSDDQPIPWDDRCVDTATTSLCDEDASVSFRSRVINTEQKKVIACLMGSDGVEDAYRDTYEGISGSHSLMGGVRTFFKHLLCKLDSSGTAEFEQYLEEMLPEFSEKGLFSTVGSGDDVSVAGIVDLDAISEHIPGYAVDVRKYTLEEELIQKESLLNSKKRKYEMLKKKVIDAENNLNEHLKKNSKYEEAIAGIDALISKLKDQEELVQRESVAYEENARQLMPILDEHHAMDHNQDVSSNVKNLLNSIFCLDDKAIDTRKEDIFNEMEIYRKRYKKLESMIAEQNQKKIQLMAMHSQNDEVAEKLQKEYDEVKKEFDAYDRQFREVDQLKADIMQSINDLELK